MTDRNDDVFTRLRAGSRVEAAPPGCKQWMAVALAMNFSFHPEELPRVDPKCWGYARPTPGHGAPPRCEWDRHALGLWAYNEIGSSAASESRDIDGLRRAHAFVATKANQTYGFLYYAYDSRRRHWETSGHVPSGIGNHVQLLELYQHQDVVTGSAFDDWHAQHRRSFGAIVNIGAPGTSDATVARWVSKVCDATQVGVMGLYAGSGERSQFTAATWKRRLTAVARALDACTRTG